MRLKFLCVIVRAASVCAPVFCSDAAPTFRGNLQHSGVYNAARVPAVGEVKWKFHAAGLVISSPAVVGDLVFVGSTDGNFYAVDRESGPLKWKFQTAGERRYAGKHLHGWFARKKHTHGFDST